MLANKPFFNKDGRLVHSDSITRAKAAEIQKAADWTAVSSSNIGYVCWRADDKDNDHHGLGVWFAPKNKKGKSTGQETVYWYETAPYSVYLGLLSATSPGSYLNENVIGTYGHIGPLPVE